MTLIVGHLKAALLLSCAAAVNLALADEATAPYDRIYRALVSTCAKGGFAERVARVEKAFATWGPPRTEGATEARAFFRSEASLIARGDSNSQTASNELIESLARQAQFKSQQAAEAEAYSKCITKMAERTSGMDPWTIQAYNQPCNTNYDAWRHVKSR